MISIFGDIIIIELPVDFLSETVRPHRSKAVIAVTF